MSGGSPNWDEIQRLSAERDEQLARRQRRRERRLYALGMTMVWAAAVVFAFGIGYSQGRRFDGTAALIFVWGVFALLAAGGVLMSVNGRGAKVWIEDPEAAERWRIDLERERLMR